NNITRILRDERISFSALDIDAMIETPLIVDLLSITRALINPADRVAWISLLRSPICGIDLQELESMYQVLSKQIAFSTLLSEKWKVAVSSDSVFRIERLLNAFSSAYQLRGRAKLHHIVLHLWEVLAVSAVYSSNDDHEILMQYVHKLSQYEPIGTIEDFRNFESALGTLYANTDSAQASKVHIMTIHKSKGLQFDIVILPSLERRPRGDESKLLQWQEITHQDGTSLAIAPIKTVGGKDAHYELLSHIDKRKQGYELTRLLYVAVTRAKIRLYLSASVELDDSSKSIKSVDKSSLFYLLKPTLEPEIRLEIKNMFTDAVSEKEGVSFKADVLRLTSESLPPYDYVLYSREETFADIQDRLLSTENQDSRYLGIMVHKGLEIIVKAKMVHWSERSGALLEMVFSQQCRELCLDKGKAAALTRQALSCIQAALRNDKASWILSSSHKDSKAEWEISGVDHKGEIRKYVVDRSFVDQGVRWVIDYKTAARGELDLEKFLRSEKEKYRGQLENYARLINGFECLPVQLGLYFPVEGAFIDWEFNSETR
ncbi:MAG: hypothetical protein OEX00_03275, partial [Gammaproteobacteria bacterium]|nr:hypothetical protein [Gammaproteobacteria bacterium]